MVPAGGLSQVRFAQCGDIFECGAVSLNGIQQVLTTIRQLQTTPLNRSTWRPNQNHLNVTQSASPGCRFGVSVLGNNSNSNQWCLRDSNQKQPCLRDSHSRAKWTQEARLNDFLSDLWRSVMLCHFPTHTVHFSCPADCYILWFANSSIMIFRGLISEVKHLTPSDMDGMNSKLQSKILSGKSSLTAGV